MTTLAGFDLKFDKFDPDVQLRMIKASIIRGDLPNILSREQRKGFPDKYTLLLRQRGRVLFIRDRAS